MKQKNRDGVFINIESKQDRLLDILYRNVWGRMLLKPLTAPIVSRVAGGFLSSKVSCVLIEPFIRKYDIDMKQFESAKYQNYNEFFSRRIRSNARTIDSDPNNLISPCDSKLQVFPIKKGSHFRVKHTDYSVSSLLQNEELAATYEGGYAWIFRLTVDDYHRYCYAADGAKEENIRIPGVLHTVNPVANDFYPIYKENSREYSILHSSCFGDLVMMEVGALLVGKIVNYHEKTLVHRGQEKGYFQFGGSTIILLTQKDRIQVDKDILENSAAGIETIVKYGEKIGNNV